MYDLHFFVVGEAEAFAVNVADEMPYRGKVYRLEKGWFTDSDLIVVEVVPMSEGVIHVYVEEVL